MAKEKNLLNRILLEAPTGTRLFRNNVGLAHLGHIVAQYNKDGHRYIVIEDPMAVRYGLCTGSGDLIGWTVVPVTAEMVGRDLAVFTSVEAKTLGARLTPEQANWLEQVQKAGGFALLIRGDEEVGKIKDLGGKNE